MGESETWHWVGSDWFLGVAEEVGFRVVERDLDLDAYHPISYLVR